MTRNPLPNRNPILAFDSQQLAQMHGELVAKKIKVNPGGRAAAFLAAQHVAVKTARLRKVGDMEGKVK